MSMFPCERLHSQSIQMFRAEICNVVLRGLLDVRVALCGTNPVQPGGVVFELLLLGEICVPLEVFLST